MAYSVKYEHVPGILQIVDYGKKPLVPSRLVGPANCIVAAKRVAGRTRGDTWYGRSIPCILVWQVYILYTGMASLQPVYWYGSFYTLFWYGKSTPCILV